MAAAADLKMESAKTVDVHLFSCDIKHRGKAKASTYFLPHVEPVDGQPGIFKSHLRGRPLKGRHLTLPEGYSGIVARSAATDTGESSTKQLYVSGRFDKITAWNWSVPLYEDRCRQINDWIVVNQALHGQCDDD
ncbi:uncharacterized protein LOC142589720 [Dermacentor variabilis]|uniref:uncharacterized protein LOC142589720 n=1 Tax=Dermacentor variabilis TaxID=34621 RepID=UPI003F5C8BEA